jgi:hypothetical protein
MLEPDAGWRWLFKLLKALDHNAITQSHRQTTNGSCGTPDPAIDTQWQLSFTQLQELSI